MVFGKEVRLSRIMKNRRMLCIPMDHGVSDGPLKGLDTINDTIEKINKGGASSILVHKGIIRSLSKTPSLGLIMHMSASTNLSLSPNRKVRVASVEEAVRLGADAVSVHINVGSKEEPEMLEKLGIVADDCDNWQIPFIAMMYPRGENIKNSRDPEILAHAARLGGELGADIVKTPYSGDPESFRRVVRGSNVPVVIAGGPKTESDRDILVMAEGAIKAGAVGVAFGRNVFQHRDVSGIVRALAKVVLENSSVDEALKVLQAVNS